MTVPAHPASPFDSGPGTGRRRFAPNREPRSSARLPLLPLALLVLAAAACRPDGKDSAREDSGRDSDSGGVDGDPEVALVAISSSTDTSSRYAFIRLDTAELLYEVNLGDLEPTCAQDDDVLCVAFGAEHRVDPDTGEDLLIAAIHFSDVTVYGGGKIPSVLSGYRLHEDGEVTTDWTLRALDFSTNFGVDSGICPLSGCVEPSDIDPTNLEHENCAIYNAHDFLLLESEDDEIRAWVTDTGGNRVLQVSLDTSMECGVVEQIVPEDNSLGGGLDFSTPNDLDTQDDDPVGSFLVNLLHSSAGEGRSHITRWDTLDDTWVEAWSYPASEDGYLNINHNPDYITGPDGETYIVYAHTNGAGAHVDTLEFDYDQDHMGTIGVARMDHAGPQYLYDAWLGSGGLRAVRDVEMLSDGTFLVADSGCLNSLEFEECPLETALWHLSLPLEGVESSGLSGRWSADHADQVLQEVETVSEGWASPFSCDFEAELYEVDPILPEDFGSALEAAIDDPVERCGAR